MKNNKGGLERKLQFGVLPRGTAEQKLKQRLTGILRSNKLN